jgi:hypothetical protein
VPVAAQDHHTFLVYQSAVAIASARFLPQDLSLVLVVYYFGQTEVTLLIARLFSQRVEAENKGF